MSAELCNELFNVRAVNGTCVFEAFHTGRGAAEAVHTDFEEIDCRRGVKIKNIANDAFSGNFHCDTKPFYYNFNNLEMIVLFFRCVKNIPQQYYFIISVFRCQYLFL